MTTSETSPLPGKPGNFLINMPVLAVLVLMVGGGMALYTLSANQNAWKTIVDHDAPFLNHIAKAELDVTVANLWYRERLGGDDAIELEEIISILNRASLRTQKAITGLQSYDPEQYGLPVPNQLYVQTETLLEDINSFKSSLQAHWKKHHEEIPALVNDEDYEAAYAVILTLCTDISEHAFFHMETVKQALDSRYKKAVISLVAIITLMALLVGLYIYRYGLAAQAAYAQREWALKEANNLLEKRVAERTEALTESNKELEQFANIASHDLQEPARKILAFTDRLISKYGDHLDDRGADYLLRMNKAALRMQELINDLLTFSRVNSKKNEFSTIELKGLVGEVLEDLDHEIEKAGATIHQGELPSLEGDRPQMRALIQNLMTNALKYRGDNPPVISIDAEQTLKNGIKQCTLTVKDNGIGFDEKYLDRIFVMFKRLHGREKYNGTGVGLAVCKKIIVRHKGSITAKSSPGNGASFVVTLPITQDQQEEQDA